MSTFQTKLFSCGFEELNKFFFMQTGDLLLRKFDDFKFAIYNWKKRERKRKNLIRLGVNSTDAFRWSRTRKGGWAVAQSPILVTTITLERLNKRGYESLYSYYQTHRSISC